MGPFYCAVLCNVAHMALATNDPRARHLKQAQLEAHVSDTATAHVSGLHAVAATCSAAVRA